MCDEAIAASSPVEKCIVVRRTGVPVRMKRSRGFWLYDLLQKAESPVAPEPVESMHPLYIRYTSGTTGKPRE